MHLERIAYTVLRIQVLLAVSCRAACQATSGEEEEDDGSGSGREVSRQPLSREAIANITVSVAALAVLGSVMCYLLMCFNKDERMQRVRMAQERNKQISRQIEEAKQKRRAQAAASSSHSGEQLGVSRSEEDRRSGGSLLFSQVHHSHHDEDGSRDKDSSPSQPLVSPTRTS